MSSPTATDLFLVQREGVRYQLPFAELSRVADTDLLLVQRDGVPYQVSGAELKAWLTPPEPPPEGMLWTPAELALGWWFDASAADTITLRPDTNFVQEWRSVGGSRGALAQQNNAATQLTYFAEANVVGVEQAGSRMDLINGGNFNGNRSLLVVSGGSASCLSGWGWALQVAGIGGGQLVLNQSTVTNLVNMSGVGFVSVVETQDSPRTLRATLLDGTSSVVNVTGNPWPEQNRLFSNSDGDGGGTVCEMVFIDTPLEPGDLERLQGYGAHKWGFAASLPPDHPYKDAPPTKPVLPSAPSFSAATAAEPTRMQELAAKRARVGGRFVADDPTTEENEAWISGEPPP